MNKLKIVLFFIIVSLQLLSVSDSLKLFKQKKILLGTASAVITTSTLLYLNQAWYQQYNTSNFHLFNDNKEWYGMDKCGHALSTYQTARLMMHAMNWAGYKKNKQLLVGGLSGFTYMTAIEIMDGYSNGWGFSWGDMLANTIGSGLAIGQKITFNKQPIQLKFSFLQSNYAHYRPQLLGKSFSEQVLKDYNGQTYWLSINPSSFIKKQNKFPKWLNVAFGYGANGMIGARYNSNLIVDANGNQKTINRYQQYYFSLDADLTRLKTKNKLLKTIFIWVNIIKIPFPNVEFSNGKLGFNPY